MINLYKYQMQAVLYNQASLFHRSTQQNDRTKKKKKAKDQKDINPKKKKKKKRQREKEDSPERKRTPRLIKG